MKSHTLSPLVGAGAVVVACATGAVPAAPCRAREPRGARPPQRIPLMLRDRRIGNPEALSRMREADGLADKGMAHLKEGRVDAAIAAFRRALAIHSYTSHAYLGLARAYTAKGQLREAARAYRTLIHPWPGKKWSDSNAAEPSVLMGFALVLHRLGDRHEASRAYLQGHKNLGIANQLASFLPTFDGPDYDARRFEAAARTVIADRLESEGRPEEEVAELRRAVSLDPRLAVAHYNLGKALCQQGKFSAEARRAARPHFERAVQFGQGRLKELARIRLAAL